GDGVVEVRIAGVVCRMRVTPRGFEGFGVFRAESHSSATLVREANLSQRRKYLELCPRALMVISARDGKRARAVPANEADARFSGGGEIELRLVDQADLFDACVARFDGLQFWFDQVDPRTDPAIAPYLRQALANMIEPKSLDRRAIVLGQRLAYLLKY